MSLNISLNPVSKTLHMYGTAHTSCSYSLSGSVRLTISKPPSLFPSGVLRSRNSISRQGPPPSIVLTSLVVTFEGKSEHLQEGAYNAVRLCDVSRQLITTPVTLHFNDDQQHAAHYDIVFDLLTIPGWLPSTFTGSDKPHSATSATSYSLFATATYHTDTPYSCPSIASTLCNFVQACNPLSGWSRADRKAHAERVEIKVVRHLVANPPASREGRPSLFPSTTYTISAQARHTSPVPNDVISRLRIVASIPSFVATSETSIPISVKARLDAPAAPTETVSEEEEGTLAIERVEIDLDQHETYLAQPDDRFTSRFALPSEQPPTHPLLHRNVSNQFDDLGLLFGDDRPKKWFNARSMLHPKAPSSFFLDSPDAPDAPNQSTTHALGADWSVMTMKATLRDAPPDSQGGCSLSPLSAVVQEDRVSPTYMSPFLRVTHSLNIALHVSYGGSKKDVVQFPLPVDFVVLPPSASDLEANVAPAYASSVSAVSRSYEPLFLPAYAQLFHEDGEARIDYSRGVPPVYRSKADGDGVGEGTTGEYGLTVKKPELVPIGTREVDLEAMRDLVGLKDF